VTVDTDPYRAFVAAHTHPGTVPYLPELRLYLADDAIALWETTEAQAGGTALPPPFWGFAWAGGQAVARHVLDHPELVAGRRVLDLACGGGVVALAAARSGAASVRAVDIDGYALAALALNAEANGLTVTGEVADLVDGEPPDVDVVLAGDVCYSREMTGRVLGFLDRARARGTDVLLGDPGRAYLPRERLELVSTHEIPVPRALEDAEVKTAAVWRLR
jgi:predicted nicotinamide N-methyase